MLSHTSHVAYMLKRRQEVVDVVDRLVVWWALQSAVVLKLWGFDTPQKISVSRIIMGHPANVCDLLLAI